MRCNPLAPPSMLHTMAVSARGHFVQHRWRVWPEAIWSHLMQFFPVLFSAT